jgi:hypothetical protein
MKAFSDIFRSQICIQVGAHGVFLSICICSEDRFNRSRLRSLRHRRAAQGGASGGKQKSLRAQSCMAGSASADRGSLGVYSVSTQRPKPWSFCFASFMANALDGAVPSNLE